MSVKVSVLMPVYNGLPLIEASIESLRMQSYNDWECVIVDDGSTDGTATYLDSLQDTKIRVFHLPQNQGRPVARQKALDMAEGEYIALLDAGDLFHPEKLRLQIEMLELNHDVDLIGSRMCSFGTKTKELFVRGEKDNCVKVFNGDHTPCHATCVLRSSIAKGIKYNPILKLGEDVDFLKKYLSGGKKYMVLPDVLYYYSELDSVSKKKISDSYKIYVKHFLSSREYGNAFVFWLKYCYSKIIFPFFSIDKILSSRGEKADAVVRWEYEEYCLPLLRKIIG